MDGRRELQLIRKQLDVYGRNVGESVMWAAYDPVNSEPDLVYNEPGYRAYSTPVEVPTLWVNLVEAGKRLDDERIDLRNHLSFAVSAEALRNANIPDVFNDDNRIFDIVQYWGRAWSIVDYDIMGRFSQADSSTIAIIANEIDLAGDYPFESPESLLDSTDPVPVPADARRPVIYQFVQIADSDRWVITHNLGHYPVAFLILLSDGTTVEADRQDVDQNILVLTFSIPHSGKAFMY